MKAFLEYLYKIPKTIIVVLGVALNVVLGIIDVLTGYEMSFSIFYLVPVFFVTWFGRKNQGVLIAFLGAGTWLWADLSSGHTYSNVVIPVWNSVMRLGFFLISVILLSEIKTLLERERSFATRDSLTGVFNSRAFKEIAAGEVQRSARYSHPFTIAYIDIDNFKQVNDTLGHGEGDKLLQSVANTLRDNTRAIDVVSRLGGDEFSILLPETNEEGAKRAIDKLQRHLMNDVIKNNWPVTFSIGVVTSYRSCNLEELIKEADRLMYSVKENGKNAITYKRYAESITNA